jgi:hypothetical protein
VKQFKPTFPTLVGRHDLMIEGQFGLLARTAKVEPSLLREMALYHKVSRKDAISVLAALSQLVRYSYTLENTDIPLLDDDNEGEA